jgi:hypothetical protein
MKYVEIDRFIAENEHLPVNELLNKLKEEPGANVIPVEFIDIWFREHYRTCVNPIRVAWESENE